MTALNHQVSLQRRVAGQDALGQPATTWEVFASPWADVRNQSGVQTLRASADISTIRASIRIRYRAGVEAGMRVTHGDLVYTIRSAIPDRKRQYLDLVCETVAP